MSNLNLMSLKILRKEIITGFGIKAVEYKEWLSRSVLMLIFVSTRATLKTIVLITRYHATIVLLIFENLFCLPAKNVISCVIFYLKLLCLHEFQACKYHLKHCNLITVFSCHMMFLTGCGMVGMWDVWNVGCGMFAGMWDVGLQNATIGKILKINTVLENIH